MKKVDIDVLREQYPEQYQREYEYWIERVQHTLGEDWPDFSEQQAEHELDGSGWVVSGWVDYAVTYSQGDGVAIAAEFNFDAACAEQQDQMRKNFPMCTEMLRLGYIEVGCSPGNRCTGSRVSCVVDFRFWVTDPEDEVVEEGVYKGLPLATAEEIVSEEDVEKFVEWLHSDVKDAESEVYRALCKDAELQQSEEEFVEWAKSFDETFEVEE